MQNKRGQGLSINAIILIVLGVLVLVLLILGFTVGWGKVLPFLNPANNVQDIAGKCQLACSQGATYDFCSATRDVVVDNPLVVGDVTIPTEFKATCFDLTAIAVLGVDECSGVVCGNRFSSESFAKAFCSKNGKVLNAVEAKTPEGEVKVFIGVDQGKSYYCAPATPTK